MDFTKQPNITIFKHPLIKHKISLLRDKEASTNKFRTLIEEIAMLEAYEALSDLPLKEVETELLVRLWIQKEKPLVAICKWRNPVAFAKTRKVG